MAAALAAGACSPVAAPTAPSPSPSPIRGTTLDATPSSTPLTKDVWNGTALEVNSRFTATDPEGIRCSDSWRMDFTFEEEAGGTLDGEGTATLVSGPDCNFEFTAPSRTFTYAVEGERVANTFSIRFAWRSGTVGVGFAAMFPIPNPVSSPVVIVTAAGRGFTGHQWELQHPGGTYTVDTPKIELFCPSCEPGN